MGSYSVSPHCPRGGEIHGLLRGLWGRLQIEDGPVRAGTIAELYAGRNPPGRSLYRFRSIYSRTDRSGNTASYACCDVEAAEVMVGSFAA